MYCRKTPTQKTVNNSCHVVIMFTPRPSGVTLIPLIDTCDGIFRCQWCLQYMMHFLPLLPVPHIKIWQNLRYIFPRFILYNFFLIFAYFWWLGVLGFGVGVLYWFFVLGFSVDGVWGLWCGAFWACWVGALYMNIKE